jgi:hypothetical protein
MIKIKQSVNNPPTRPYRSRPTVGIPYFHIRTGKQGIPPYEHMYAPAGSQF